MSVKREDTITYSVRCKNCITLYKSSYYPQEGKVPSKQEQIEKWEDKGWIIGENINFCGEGCKKAFQNKELLKSDQIKSAAIKTPKGSILIGKNYGEIIQENYGLFDEQVSVRGFITIEDKFVDRKTALENAKKIRKIKEFRGG